MIFYEKILRGQKIRFDENCFQTAGHIFKLKAFGMNCYRSVLQKIAQQDLIAFERFEIDFENFRPER